MATSLSGLSASVTRILSLTGFPKELKTKDIQAAFSEWENLNGGFKIKWKDDTSLLIVFQDPVIAKRAYLNTIAFPPPILTSPTGVSATIKPYDGPDAQAVIQTVNSRGHASNPSRHNARSVSVTTYSNGRDRASSSSSHGMNNNFRNGRDTALHISLSGGSAGSIQDRNGNGLKSPTSAGREPSPTLPSIPSHPTLGALIGSSLGDGVADITLDPAIVSTSADSPPGGGPRIGDPGKRMLGAALGMRHPGLGPRMSNGNQVPDQALREVQKAMGGLVVAE